ncbi:MAG: protein kinase [Aestuariibacter sp.]
MNQVNEVVSPDIPGYSILACLGTGGMGSVYVAQDLRLERRVAIKIIEKSHLDNMYLQEASIQAQINHINVVQIFDVIELEAFIAVVMEYVEGHSLLKACAVEIPGESQKLKWLLEIAQGMEAIHRKKIVHSDLSMNNIVVTADKQIKLLDFGIAQKLSSDKPLVATHANSHYASPEQLTQQPIDFRSDLFSFGIIAFQLMTNQHPFGEPDNRQERIKSGQSIAPQDISPEISDLLSALLVQLLSTEVKHRPNSFEEVIIRLKRCLAQASQEHLLTQVTVPIEPTNPPNIEAAPQIKRTPLFGLVSVILLVALVLVYIWEGVPAPKPVTYVLVDRLNTNGAESLNDEQKMQVQASIEHAIYQYVIDHPNLRLVPRSEIEADNYSTQQLADSSGINNIISSQIDCQQGRCIASLSQFEAEKTEFVGSKWQIVAQQTWPTQTQDSRAIALATTSHLMKLFPPVQQYDYEVGLNGEDYDDYLAIFNEVKIQGKRQPETWRALLGLIQKQPDALSAYWLLRELSIDLYYASNESNYLADFLHVLERAPTLYRESEIGLTDRFLVSLAAGELAESQRALLDLINRGIDRSFQSELHARLLFAKGDYEQAAIQYQLAANERQSISLLHNLGLSFYYAGEVEKAKHALQKALDINPDYYMSNQLLASLYLLTEELDKAIVAYEQLFKHQKNSQDLSDLSIAYMLKGDFAKGIHYAESAIALAPNNPVQMLNLADLLHFSGDVARAQELYSDVLAIQVEQNDTDALLLKAQALVHLGQHQEAIAAINQAEKNAADNIEVLYTAALIYTQVGELVSAAVHVQDAMSQGIGPLWFNIPWFTPMCSTPWFAKQMGGLNATTICTN